MHFFLEKHHFKFVFFFQNFIVPLDAQSWRKKRCFCWKTIDFLNVPKKSQLFTWTNVLFAKFNTSDWKIKSKSMFCSVLKGCSKFRCHNLSLFYGIDGNFEVHNGFCTSIQIYNMNKLWAIMLFSHKASNSIATRCTTRTSYAIVFASFSLSL